MEHSAIPDAERHQPKGASTASPNTFLVATGNDQTTFRALLSTDIPALTLDKISDLSKASTQAASTATDVAGVVADLNALLVKLKAAGIMEV